MPKRVACEFQLLLDEWRGSDDQGRLAGLPRPHIYRGEIVPASDPRVEGHPDMWEELSPLEERDPTPGRDEPAAVAQANFVVDGRMVFRGAHFWPDYPLVRAYPGAFIIQLP